MASSRAYSKCSVCEVERLTKTLDKLGRCPFCEDKAVPTPPEPPPPKKVMRKRTTAVKIDKSKPGEPAAAPAEALKKQDLIPEDVLGISYEAPNYSTPTSPQQELAMRELCRRRLMPFIQRFRPKYSAGWVHEDICRRLERFMKQVELGQSPRLLLMMPPRHGKLLADNTLVPTPCGWKRHGDLQAGDEVFHPSGKAVKVLATSSKDVANVRIRFSDGAEYLCHENHEWTLFNRKRGTWQTLETRQLIEKKLLSRNRCLYQLPVVAALEYSGEAYSMHPYVLGAWLGDGSATKPCITGAKSDKPVIDKIVSLGYSISSVCEHATTGVLTTYFSGNAADTSETWGKRGPKPSRMTQELNALGLIGAKHIPEHYQRLKKELRLELLAGLIDTDGHTDQNGRVRFTTTSERLATDVVQLCAGLGFRPYTQRIEPRTSSSGIEGRLPYYVVGFQPTEALPVALQRKQPVRLADQRRVGVVSVERVEEGELGQCIEVDSPDGLYVVGERMTTTHNSEIGSRHFPPWVLGHHPDWEIIAASHTSSLTLSFSRYIRDVMRDPAYAAVYPQAVLDPSSQSIENWNLTKGGGYLAAGVGTGITGRGAHILLLDDLVKDMEAADSATIKDNTWEWYGSTAYTRLAPGGGVLGIMTWWSEDDWAGRIQATMKGGEGDVFEIVRYPAINEEGDEYILPNDHIDQFTTLERVPEGSRLTRPKGTALHPARYDTEAVLRIKRNLIATGQKRVWQSLYQQNPMPEDGLFFTKEMFRYTPSLPDPHWCRVFQAWDFAITEDKASDYTVGCTLYQDEYDNLFVADVRRFRSSDSIYIVDTMLDYAQEFNASLLGFEDGQIWKTMQAQFDKRCAERKFYPSYEILKPLTDKQVRAHPLRGRMQAGKIWFPDKAPWFTECFNEMTRFPAGKHDDQIDSLAWAVRLTLDMTPPKPKVAAKPVKSWKDDLSKFMAGQQGRTHMSS